MTGVTMSQRSLLAVDWIGRCGAVLLRILMPQYMTQHTNYENWLVMLSTLRAHGLCPVAVAAVVQQQCTIITQPYTAGCSIGKIELSARWIILISY